ncbi:hypothetical protein B0H13DRAFT_1727815 [Mycena leptocephala]|nr:hypothetical protein B0H13DRAFT_1727815 [Mycena leptocephala]
MPPNRRGQAFDVALDNATPVLEFAGDVLNLVPVPGLSLVAKGLSVLLDGVKNARANHGARRAFMDEIKALDGILVKMAKDTSAAVNDDDVGRAKKALVDGVAKSEGLQSRVEELSSTIVDLRERIKDLKGGPGFFGAFEGFVYSSRNKATLSEMKDDLASAIRIFTFQGQMSIEHILSDVVQEARKIIQGQKDAEEKQVLDSIPRAAAGYRSVDELKGEFLDGTRRELFQELDLWSVGDSSCCDQKRFYLLSGGAGLGKSSIAHQLCTRLDLPNDKPALGASFFFVRNSGDLESTRLLFPSLAHQLALSQAGLRPHIIGAAREYLKRGDRQQMKHAFEELVRQPLAAASLVPQQPVVIVIDGLDECKEREQVPHLLGFLLELVQALPWVRLFVTSRPEPHILSVITSADASAALHHRSLQDTLNAWSGDVEHYLEETLSKMHPYGEFVRDQPRFLELLTRRAGGVFIFARLAVRFLDTYRDHPNPQEQFELLLLSGGEGLSPLDDLYLQILRSAFPPNAFRASHLLSFLTIIALQRHPLTPQVMALFESELSTNEIIWMSDRLRSALLVDNEGCVVPLHATFREFLLDPKRCIDPLYHINKSKGQAQLASACMAAFTFENMSVYLAGNTDAPVWHYIYHLTGCWNFYLAGAEFNKQLKQQFMRFLGSQIPVHMRDDILRRAESIIYENIVQWFEVSEQFCQ